MSDAASASTSREVSAITVMPELPLSRPPFACSTSDAAWECRCGRTAIRNAAEYTSTQHAPLVVAFEPRELLASDERVLLRGAQGWLLYGRNLDPVATSDMDVVALCLDGRRGVFLALDRAGQLSTYRLETGELVQRRELPEPAFYQNARLIMTQDTLVVFGQMSDALPGTADVALLLHISAPSLQELPGSGPITTSFFVTRESSVATTASTVVLGLHDQIATLDAQLHPLRMLNGSFESVALSVDESQWTYQVTECAGVRAFWLLAPDGRRTVDYRLPSPVDRAAQPPIVGFDHAAYLIGGHRIMCISQVGELQWMRPIQSECCGAVVTPDGVLLAADETGLVAFDACGQRQVLCEFPGEALQLPPVQFGQSGEIVVCSATHLHWLRPAGRSRSVRENSPG